MIPDFCKIISMVLLCNFYNLMADDGVLFLDYASSWSLNKKSIDEFVKIASMNGNSSGINKNSVELKKLENIAAEIIARKINANSNCVHFTSGATLSNNIAILGVAHANPGCHLITSKIEHSSVLKIFKSLEKSGYSVSYINVDKYGIIDINHLKKEISANRNTKLISIQSFNSEIGSRQNLKEIGKIAKKNGILFHTDAAQSFCKYAVDVQDMNIDLLTMSGHKIGSPRGIGALYVKNSKFLKPIFYGSGDRFFPGTKSTELISSFAKAVEFHKINYRKISNNYDAIKSILEKIDNVFINSSTPSHVISIAIGGVLLNDVMDRMKLYSFSAGCSCLGSEKSNVISAIDPNDQLPGCILRISFTDMVSVDNVEKFAKTLKMVILKLRAEKSIDKNCENKANVNKKEMIKSIDSLQSFLNES